MAVGLILGAVIGRCSGCWSSGCASDGAATAATDTSIQIGLRMLMRFIHSLNVVVVDPDCVALNSAVRRIFGKQRSISCSVVENPILSSTSASSNTKHSNSEQSMTEYRCKISLTRPGVPIIKSCPRSRKACKSAVTGRVLLALLLLPPPPLLEAVPPPTSRSGSVRPHAFNKPSAT